MHRTASRISDILIRNQLALIGDELLCHRHSGFWEGRVHLPRHGAHKARKVRWITRDGANNS